MSNTDPTDKAVTITVDAGRLAAVRALIADLNRFRDEQADDLRGEPKCGYPQFDETVTDYARDIAEAVEGLL